MTSGFIHVYSKYRWYMAIALSAPLFLVGELISTGIFFVVAIVGWVFIHSELEHTESNRPPKLQRMVLETLYFQFAVTAGVFTVWTCTVVGYYIHVKYELPHFGLEQPTPNGFLTFHLWWLCLATACYLVPIVRCLERGRKAFETE